MALQIYTIADAYAEAKRRNDQRKTMGAPVWVAVPFPFGAVDPADQDGYVVVPTPNPVAAEGNRDMPHNFRPRTLVNPACTCGWADAETFPTKGAAENAWVDHFVGLVRGTPGAGSAVTTSIEIGGA